MQEQQRVSPTIFFASNNSMLAQDSSQIPADIYKRSLDFKYRPDHTKEVVIDPKPDLVDARPINHCRGNRLSSMAVKGHNRSSQWDPKTNYSQPEVLTEHEKTPLRDSLQGVTNIGDLDVTAPEPRTEGTHSLQLFRRVRQSAKSQVGRTQQLHIIPLESSPILMNYESLSGYFMNPDLASATANPSVGSKVGHKITMRVSLEGEKSFSQTNKHSKYSAMETNASSLGRPKISARLRLAGSAVASKSSAVQQTSSPPRDFGQTASPPSIFQSRRRSTYSPVPCAGDRDETPSFPIIRRTLKDLRLFQVPQDTSQAVQSSKQKLTVTATSHESDGLFLPKKFIRYETQIGAHSSAKLQAQEIATPDKYKNGPVCFAANSSGKSSRDDLNAQPVEYVQRRSSFALRPAKSMLSHDQEPFGLVPTFTMQNVSWEGQEEVDEESRDSDLRADPQKSGHVDDNYSDQLKLDTNLDLEEMVRKCSVLNKKK